MPHAGHVHHDQPDNTPQSRPAASPPPQLSHQRWPIAAFALGGMLTLGAVAAGVAFARGADAKPKKAKAKKRKPRA